MNILNQAYDFKTDGEPVFCMPYGSGHINRTYLLVDSTAGQYILQMINKNVFKDPESLMRNVSAVTTHLRKSAVSSRETLQLLPAKDGKLWIIDSDGEYWRMYRFISDSMCLDKAGSADDLRECGAAFGHFQLKLADFPAHTLTETIPDFHNTPARYAAFKAAVKEDKYGRVKDSMYEIEFILERERYAKTLVDLQASGELPLRVTHNDSKLNNVLFDRETRRGLCVIDLDTVMPGLAAYDFGDSIRSGASAAAEDERDLCKVSFSLPLYMAYAEGFLSAFGKSLTRCELEHLRDGAKMMTLECGVRFLTDHLNGDVYFKIHRNGQNLDRARTQFKLVRDMESKWEEMRVNYS